jgi:hypothetical protein
MYEHSDYLREQAAKYFEMAKKEGDSFAKKRVPSVSRNLRRSRQRYGRPTGERMKTRCSHVPEKRPPALAASAVNRRFFSKSSTGAHHVNPCPAKKLTNTGVRSDRNYPVDYVKKTEDTMSNCSHRGKTNTEQEYHRPPAEIIRLLGKLRWIGMDDEAEELQAQTQESGVIGGILTVPRETD